MSDYVRSNEVQEIHLKSQKLKSISPPAIDASRMICDGI
jgi:hypothetical protein